MARRQVSIFINGRQVENTIKGITSEKRKLNRELNRMEIGSREYVQTSRKIKDLDGVLREHRRGLRDTSTAWDKLKGGLRNFAGIAAGAFAVDALVGYGKELFRLGAEMEVLSAKAETVFAEALPQVTAAAEENAAAMGLSEGQYIDAAAAIGDLLVPMGFMRDEAADISTNLVDLSGALSEWTGGQVSAEQASNALSKALLGEREELKGLGIAISEADVKQRLIENGTDKLTGKMLEQAKATATLQLVMEKSTDAQAAFAGNSDTLIRKQAELQAQFRTIQESLAQALIPVMHRLLEAVVPIVDRVTDWITATFQAGQSSHEFSGILGALGTIVRNVAKSLGFSLRTMRDVTLWILDKMGPAIEIAVVAFARLYNGAIQLRNELRKLTGRGDQQLELIDVEALKVSLSEARKAIKDYRLGVASDAAEVAGQQPATPSPAPGAPPRPPGPSAPTGGGGRQRERLGPEHMRRIEEQEALLEELSVLYDDMEETARLNGLELADIQLETELQRTDIVRKAVEERNQLREEEEKAAIEALKANARAMEQRFTTAGQVIGNVLELVGDKSAAAAQFSRLLTIAQLGIDSARAISAAVAASAGVPFPGNLAAIATSVTTVIGNIAAAKKLLGEATVPQRARGGWFWVTGQDDGRRYNARHIGRPGTGLLQHGHPVLIDSASGGSVLANERGPEYFVANHDLRNPKVLSYVRAIDNLTRTRQYQEGGFTAPPPTGASEPPSESPDMQRQLETNNMLMRALIDQLRTGIVARIDDDTIIDLRNRTSELIDASGGALD